MVRIERDAGTPCVALSPDSPFDDIRDALRALFADEHGDATGLAGLAVQLDFGARDLVLFDLRRLVNLLRDEFEVTVAGVRCTQDTLLRYAEQSLKLRVFLEEPELAEPGIEGPELELDEEADGATLAPPELEVAPTDAPVAPLAALVALASAEPETDAGPDVAGQCGEAADGSPPTDPSVEPELNLEQSVPTLVAAESADGVDVADARAYAVHRTLRSGAKVRHPGDIVVYGDVNAGAEVEADGNIVVLGALRGLAHAGARGDESAVILSFDLRPTQIRIGNRIAFPPARVTPQSPGLRSLLQRDRPSGRSYKPEIARIEDGTIVLEDYRGRLPAAAR